MRLLPPPPSGEGTNARRSCRCMTWRLLLLLPWDLLHSAGSEAAALPQLSRVAVLFRLLIWHRRAPLRHGLRQLPQQHRLRAAAPPPRRRRLKVPAIAVVHMTTTLTAAIQRILITIAIAIVITSTIMVAKAKKTVLFMLLKVTTLPPLPTPLMADGGSASGRRQSDGRRGSGMRKRQKRRGLRRRKRKPRGSGRREKSEKRRSERRKLNA